jgi:hypothetical protein
LIVSIYSIFNNLKGDKMTKTRKVGCNICRTMYTVNMIAGTYTQPLVCTCKTILIHFSNGDLITSPNATTFTDGVLSENAISDFKTNKKISDYMIHPFDKTAFLTSRCHHTYYKGLKKYNKTAAKKFGSLAELYTYLKVEKGWNYKKISDEIYNGKISLSSIRRIYRLIASNAINDLEVA